MKFGPTLVLVVALMAVVCYAEPPPLQPPVEAIAYAPALEYIDTAGLEVRLMRLPEPEDRFAAVALDVFDSQEREQLTAESEVSAGVGLS